MRLVVYSGNMKAGMLDMADSESFYGFTYDKAYLASGRPALSLSLPLQAARFSGDQALGFFEGLLPEGDVRASVARQLGISERSPAKLLRALGKDCAGDIAVLEEDDPYQPPAEAEYAPIDNALERIAGNPYGEISRLRAGNRLSLAGGQEKIALYHDDRAQLTKGWYAPLGGSPSTHIIKPQVSSAYPHLIYNEFLCMTLARAVGIDVAGVEVLAFERPLLVVNRFDREQNGELSEEGLAIYRRLRQEDFCQALGFSSSKKYEMDGGPSVHDACDLLLGHSARFIKDRDSLLKLVLFNYIIGNCDAHAKNYAIMLGSGGAIALAPAYDLVSTTVYDGSYGAEISRSMGMRIGEHANIDRITIDDFMLLAADVMVSEVYLAEMGEALSRAITAHFEETANQLIDRACEGTAELAERIWLGIEKRMRLFS